MQLRFRKSPEICLFLYFGLYGVYLIAKDQIYLDKACRVNMRDWLEEQGYNVSLCNNKDFPEVIKSSIS